MPTTIQLRGVLVVEGLEPPQYSPLVQPIQVARASDDELRISVIDSYGAPVDLTGCAVVMAIKAAPQDLSPLISRLAAVVDAAGGIAVCTLSAAETFALAVGSYVYDVWLTQANALRSQIIPVSTFGVTAAVVAPGVTPTIQLPSIQGQAGKVLGNDGTILEWVVVVKLNPRGAWVSGEDYAVNDIVQDDGSTYRCTVAIGNSTDVPGDDTDHFEAWALRGDQGATGPTGPAGGGLSVQRFVYSSAASLGQYVMPSSPSGRASLDFPLYRATGGETIVNFRVEGRTPAVDVVAYEIQKSSDQGTTVVALAPPFVASVTAGNKAGVAAGPSPALTAGDWITAKVTADNGGAGGDWVLMFDMEPGG